MNRTRTTRNGAFAILVAIALAVTGCAETEFLADSMKRLTETPTEGRYKVGKPYKVNGKWYQPKVDNTYNETGLASWYGEDFHGKNTANGETYDMNAVSGAHKTLPLPSMVRVTNLGNGRMLNVRINDRGPFSAGRIIDLSRRSAQLLDFEKAGTAMVRVEILPRESNRLAAALNGEAIDETDNHPTPESAPRLAVRSAKLKAPVGSRQSQPPSPNHVVLAIADPAPPPERKPVPLATVDGSVTTVDVGSEARLFVQAGAFSQYTNAYRIKVKLQGIAPATIRQVTSSDARLFRVRLGPVFTVKDADFLLARVNASGILQARIVVD